MARKVREISRCVYRKSIDNTIFLKIYKNKKALIVKVQNLFTDAEIQKSNNPAYFNLKDNKKQYNTARKKEFMQAYRKARQEIRV